VEHLADELDARRLVWVLLLEVHDKLECAVLEVRVRRPNYDRVPVSVENIVSPYSSSLSLSLSEGGKRV
jgi:hypothetical protein